MPNWNMNIVTLTATTDAHRAVLRKVVEACLKDKPEPILTILKPMPENIYRGMLGEAERAIHGANNWYDWGIANWGTKWDTSAVVTSEDGDSVTLNFDTAWAPPIALYNTMISEGWEVFAYYYEPGMAFAGIYDNGDDRFYDDLSDNFLTFDDDGIELDDTFAILEERANAELDFEE